MEFNARSDPGMEKGKRRKKKRRKRKKKSSRVPPRPIIQLNPLRRYLMGRDDVTSFWTRATNHRRFTVGCKKRRTTRRFIFFILSFSLSLAPFSSFISLVHSSFSAFVFSFPFSFFFFFFFFDRSTTIQRAGNEQRGGREGKGERRGINWCRCHGSWTLILKYRF